MKTLILKSLCYFDIFDHPLNKKDLGQIIGCHAENEELSTTLMDLCKDSHCYEHRGYYSINADIENQVKQRHSKELLAQSYLKKLPFYSKLIKSFPFVKAIAISGSLSKRVMYQDGDIDYFIITQKNRLWICRTLLVFFKKLFLLNSRKYFCVNYFVDEENLEIIDKNIFTAMEISYLAPVYNSTLLEEMKGKNAWVKDHIPNFTPQLLIQPMESNSKLKSLIEGLFLSRLANWLDLKLMALTFWRWKKKFKNFDPDKLELTMRSRRGVSKHHPSDFQTKVLAAYQERISKIKIEHESTVHA